MRRRRRIPHHAPGEARRGSSAVRGDGSGDAVTESAGAPADGGACGRRSPPRFAGPVVAPGMGHVHTGVRRGTGGAPRGPARRRAGIDDHRPRPAPPAQPRRGPGAGGARTGRGRRPRHRRRGRRHRPGGPGPCGTDPDRGGPGGAEAGSPRSGPGPGDRGDGRDDGLGDGVARGRGGHTGVRDRRARRRAPRVERDPGRVGRPAAARRGRDHSGVRRGEVDPRRRRRLCSAWRRWG